MLSGWHVHAKGYANELRQMPDARITAVWDELPERGKEWAQELDAPFEPDLNAFVARDDIDAVCVNAPTNRHAEVMIAAAKAKKHIFTEKVTAITVTECDAISAAVREAGVKFCISLPQRTLSKHLFAKRVVDEKLIGELTFLRVRVAHNGSSAGWLPPHFRDPVPCGGGAMYDLGAHPMYLARWLGGKPLRVSSTFNYFTEDAIEDNAVSVIEFENKCIGIAETSFVSARCPDSIEMHGTAGGVFIGGPDNDVRISSEKMDGPLRGWLRPTELPQALPRPIRIWVEGILEDKPIPFGLEEGTQLTALMEAAYVSHKQGSAAAPVSR